MRITNAARELGISADWLRRLERHGRVPPARRDLRGHRRYTAEDVHLLRQTLFPTDVSFTAPALGPHNQTQPDASG